MARNRNKKWGILKYLSAEFFFEKSENIMGQRVYKCRILGQKSGYDIFPYLSQNYISPNYLVIRFGWYPMSPKLAFPLAI